MPHIQAFFNRLLSDDRIANPGTATQTMRRICGTVNLDLEHMEDGGD